MHATQARTWGLLQTKTSHLKQSSQALYRMHDLKNGHGHISLKVPNIKFDFDVRFLMYLYLLTKPNVEIENYESL